MSKYTLKNFKAYAVPPAPIQPTAPPKELEKLVFVESLHDDEVDLLRLLSRLGVEDKLIDDLAPSLENYVLQVKTDHSDYSEYTSYPALEVYKRKLVPNKIFKSQMKAYEKALVKYKKEVADHPAALKEWERLHKEYLAKEKQLH